MSVLDTRSVNVLTPPQKRIGDRCELLVRGFDRVGIVALIDEATGYERIREKRALVKKNP